MQEFYSGVKFYGHGNILRRYSKFPKRLPLPVCVQHGWMKAPIQHDARTDAAENWYWSSSIAEQFKEKFPFIKYRVVGAPFLYCLKNICYQEEKFELRKGTIVFPFHNTDQIEFYFDNEQYCDMLHALPKIYKPITICLHSHDINKKNAKIFSKRGFEIVCNGDDPCDDYFLYNFIKNVRYKKYFMTNEWSTAMHYASIMGIKVFLYGPEVRPRKITDPNIDEEYFRQHWEPFKKENSQFYRLSGSCQYKQYQIAAYELGMDNMMSERKMRLTLWRLVLTIEYIAKCTIFFKFKKKIRS